MPRRGIRALRTSYRASAGYLLDLVGSRAVKHSEFTDNHDFMALEKTEDLSFHHNFVDNFNDDGFEPGEKRAHGKLLFYENFVSRCLSPITAHAKKPTPVEAEPGSGCYWYRNVFDLRQGIYRTPPTAADETGEFLNSPIEMVDHDHGNPIHAVAYVYQNTFLLRSGAFRGYYAFGWASACRGTTRRIFNNIFMQMEGEPGTNSTGLKEDDDFQADGNLSWSAAKGPQPTEEVFQKLRASPLFAASKARYAPGLGAHDRYDDPKFIGQGFRLGPDSAAAGAGVAVPG